MKELYDVLRHYGEIIADKNHQTIQGDFIRFTTFKYNDSYYVVTKFNGDVFMIAEKEDIAVTSISDIHLLKSQKPKEPMRLVKT